MTNKRRNTFSEGWVYKCAAYFLIALIVIILIASLCLIAATIHAGPITLSMAVVAGTAGGKHVVGGPVTTDILNDETSLLLNEIDSHIVKIRPMATPIDQISRWNGSKHCGSMVVDYYSVDTKPTVVLLQDDYTETSATEGSSGVNKAVISTSNSEIFEPTETILVKGVEGYADDGVTPSGNDLVLYVLGKTESGDLRVIAVNGKKIGSTMNCVPSLDSGTTLIRMGRAASELDVQTSQFESLPVKAQNYCQIFKMQIEQSTFAKIANKEANWSFSDQEEAAIYDMRLGMEKNFLFGAKRKIYDPEKHEDVMLTGGIWFQAGKTFSYSESSFTQDTLIDIMRNAFTGNAGSKRKVLIGGSGLIGAINKIDTTKVISAGENFVKWGIDFSEIRSKFGKLYVLLSEVFDECGMPDNGLIVDPEYIQKYSHIPFSTEALDLKAAGIRNTDAIVITEASCLTLRYPNAHMRIVKS